MTGAEALAWLVICWFIAGTTWDVIDPDALQLTINSWPRAILALIVQIVGIVLAASVVALSVVGCVLLGAFFILALVIAVNR